MMATRHNPTIGLDEDDEVQQPEPVARKPRPSEEDIADLAKAHGLQSRQQPSTPTAPKRPQRRHTTGRNIQLNVKATAETVELFYSLADKMECTQAEVLERALQALRKTIKG
jgi:hypothetical protein